MSTDTRNIQANSDDIDLLLLIERALRFFRRYKWVFTIAAILGILAGILMYRSLPKIYQSRLVLHSYLLTNPEQIQIVTNWNELLQKKEYGSLATALHCDEKMLHSVRRMKAEEIQKVSAASNPSGFIIDVNLATNAVLDSLQKAIVDGFENAEYIKERLEVRRMALQELIGKTATEVQKLDSTKKEVENIIGGKGRSSSSLIVDGSSINKQLIEMNEKLLGYKSELQFTNAVQVLQSFNKFEKPTGPKLIPWIIIGLLVFLSIGFLYSILSSVNAKLRSRSLSSNK